MPHRLIKLTPNLIVSDLQRTLEFYRDVLGFSVVRTVPDAPPFVFAIVQSGGVEVFLNARDVAVAEYPALDGQPIGGTLTLFVEVEDVRTAYEALRQQVRIVMPLETKWYGLTEFAFADPDGYLVTYAEREK